MPVKANQRRTETTLPKASHEGSGWCRLGEISKTRATAAAIRAAPMGHRPIDQAVSAMSLQPLTSPSAVPEARAEDDEDERADGGQSGGQREQGRDRVLGEGGAVALDAVDAVGAAFDLAHRAGSGDDRREASQDEGEGVVVAVLGALLERLGEDLAGRAGGDAVDRVGEDVGERALSQHRCEADHGDQSRQEREHQLEGESARVAEAVGVAEAQGSALDQGDPADGAKRFARLVALELEVAGLWDFGGGAHGRDASSQRRAKAPRPAADHQGMTETATQTAPVPGWYQDPQGQGLRWWDGTGWTTHVQQSAPPAQPAAAAAPQVQPVQAAPAATPPATGGPPAVASSSNASMKVTGGDKKKSSGGSLSDKLNDNPVPVLLVLAAVLIVVFVLFVL